MRQQQLALYSKRQQHLTGQQQAHSVLTLPLFLVITMITTHLSFTFLSLSEQEHSGHHILFSLSIIISHKYEREEQHYNHYSFSLHGFNRLGGARSPSKIYCPTLNQTFTRLQ